jgi:hypothetical protein
MKKICTLGLVLMMLVVLVRPIPVQAASSFSDISKHWAETSILQLASLGYISGYTNGTFKPDNSMTRAEFTTVLVKCMGLDKSSTATTSFSDVKNHWAAGYINTAVNKGVLIPSEYPNGLKPDGVILRSEAAAMLVRALGQQPGTGSLSSFSDNAEIEKSMYKGYIKTAFDLGLMSGYSGKFVPFGAMTRGQVCTVMTTYLGKKGVTLPTTTTTTTTTTGSTIKTLVIGDQSYSLDSQAIVFKIGSTDVTAATLSATQNALLLNGSYQVKLAASQDNPDLIVNNLDYKISSYSLSGDKLIAKPTSFGIYSVSVDGYKYYAYYTNLYINGAYGENYLSDMQIIDANTVSIDGTNYLVGRDRLTIESGNYSYDITGILLSNTDNKLLLTTSTSVIKSGLKLTDFAAIFADTDTINLDDITSINFIVDGTSYALNNVVIDANGNFVVGKETFSPSKVYMIIDSTNYKINSLQSSQNKYILYCTESDTSEWVIVNDTYRDPSDVRIQKDDSIYSMDQTVVVSKNLIQVGGHRYTLDSTFRCLMDNKSYEIESATYNISKQATVLEVNESSSSALYNLPSKYVFYVDDVKYLDGASSAVEIKAGTSWVSFDDLFIPDPAHFTYQNTQYNVIGSQIRINQKDYTVVDSVWHGQTQVFDLYLQ